MAQYTVLDRSGEPLRYLGRTITFPSEERARAFCGHACRIAIADADKADEDAVCAKRVPDTYRDHYLEVLRDDSARRGRWITKPPPKRGQG